MCSSLLSSAMFSTRSWGMTGRGSRWRGRRSTVLTRRSSPWRKRWTSCTRPGRGRRRRLSWRDQTLSPRRRRGCCSRGRWRRQVNLSRPVRGHQPMCHSRQESHYHAQGHPARQAGGNPQ